MLVMEPIPAEFTGRNQSPRNMGKFGVWGFALDSNLPVGVPGGSKKSRTPLKGHQKNQETPKKNCGVQGCDNFAANTLPQKIKKHSGTRLVVGFGNRVLGAAWENVTASGLFHPHCCLYK